MTDFHHVIKFSIFMIWQYDKYEKLSSELQLLDERTFRYEFFVRTPPRSYSNTHKKRDFPKNVNFPIFGFGMSSYSDEFSRWKMTSLMYFFRFYNMRNILQWFWVFQKIVNFFLEKISTFFFEFQNLSEIIFLVIACWLFESNLIISLPHLTRAQWNWFFELTHKFFQKCLKNGFSHVRVRSWRSSHEEFLRSAKFFHRKVWNLENIFNISLVIISSVYQKLQTIFCKKLSC